MHFHKTSICSEAFLVQSVIETCLFFMAKLLRLNSNKEWKKLNSLITPYVATTTLLLIAFCNQWTYKQGSCSFLEIKDTRKDLKLWVFCEPASGLWWSDQVWWEAAKCWISYYRLLVHQASLSLSTRLLSKAAQRRREVAGVHKAHAWSSNGLSMVLCLVLTVSHTGE